MTMLHEEDEDDAAHVVRRCRQCFPCDDESPPSQEQRHQRHWRQRQQKYYPPHTPDIMISQRSSPLLRQQQRLISTSTAPAVTTWSDAASSPFAHSRRVEFPAVSSRCVLYNGGSSSPIPPGNADDRLLTIISLVRPFLTLDEQVLLLGLASRDVHTAVVHGSPVLAVDFCDRGSSQLLVSSLFFQEMLTRLPQGLESLRVHAVEHRALLPVMGSRLRHLYLVGLPAGCSQFSHASQSALPSWLTAASARATGLVFLSLKFSPQHLTTAPARVPLQQQRAHHPRRRRRSTPSAAAAAPNSNHRRSSALSSCTQPEATTAATAQQGETSPAADNHSPLSLRNAHGDFERAATASSSSQHPQHAPRRSQQQRDDEEELAASDCTKSSDDDCGGCCCVYLEEGHEPVADNRAELDSSICGPFDNNDDDGGGGYSAAADSALHRLSMLLAAATAGGSDASVERWQIGAFRDVRVLELLSVPTAAPLLMLLLFRFPALESLWLQTPNLGAGVDAFIRHFRQRAGKSVKHVTLCSCGNVAGSHAVLDALLQWQLETLRIASPNSYGEMITISHETLTILEVPFHLNMTWAVWGPRLARLVFVMPPKCARELVHDFRRKTFSEVLGATERVLQRTVAQSPRLRELSFDTGDKEPALEILGRPAILNFVARLEKIRVNGEHRAAVGRG